MADIFDLFRKIEQGTAPRAPVSWLLVGLGNPGEKYTFTRHNAGFLALDYISQRLDVKINRAKFDALCGEASIGSQGVLLLKPQTFMNESGRAVRQAADFYKIAPDHIIVLSDDVSLDVGVVRVRKSGTDGGQKGLRSIIYQLNSDQFPRIKMGVGAKPHPEMDMADWVLSHFNEGEQKQIFERYDDVLGGVEKIIAGDIEGAMMLCNKKITK
ncbi:MAG: aminoacyl-tRNA hydrolase [Ruminococcaceae bacterium]|nr:aminoacyl-tRNA hydrolase [Oscillospiraceae bacterium]